MMKKRASSNYIKALKTLVVEKGFMEGKYLLTLYPEAVEQLKNQYIEYINVT